MTADELWEERKARANTAVPTGSLNTWATLWKGFL